MSETAIETPVYYDGPVCYVGDGAAALNVAGEPVEAGWHYTTVVDEEAKKLARDAAAAAVALWEGRAAKAVIGRFAQAQLEAAREALVAVEAATFEVPGERLHLEDTEDGSGSRYRLATAEDTRSWHDRKHRQFSAFELEDVAGAEKITDEAEVAAVRETLDRIRAEKATAENEEGGEAK